MKLDMNIDEYLPLREVVFHTLRKAIIQGELQPGERLMEVTLPLSVYLMCQPDTGT